MLDVRQVLDVRHLLFNFKIHVKEKENVTFSVAEKGPLKNCIT